ncbi:EamA family transporter RarD [Microbacterium sp. A84]|uniref:EamA family transporter RarD n=1 Tax=Microbacterium sp. A84 TaxID=3450715 RepID=UPI003F41D7EE
MQHTSPHHTECLIIRSVLSQAAGRGIAASLLASVLFGVISVLGGHLDGFAPAETTAWRVLFILIPLLAVHASSRARTALKAVTVRITRSPKLLLIVLVNSAIIWVQLWVFMWGPANGHAQDIAFGYFLLPLAMVVVGRVFFRDRLNRMQWSAVAAACVGVLAQFLIAGGVNWPVAIIAGLYPIYFALRRWTGLDSMQVFLIEIIVLIVPAVVVIVVSYASDPARTIPDTWPLMLLMASLSGVAMTLYILASRLLPLSLFGLLSYLEPVLLLGAALLLGESFTVNDAFVYIPIVIALALLGMSGRRYRGRSRIHLEEPPL